jgi:putative glutamine amidotransferase
LFHAKYSIGRLAAFASHTKDDPGVTKRIPGAVKIGLSYDQGTPKYRLYLGAVLASAAQLGYADVVEPVWLAGAAQPLDREALDEIDGLLLVGGADVEPHRYGERDPEQLCSTFPGRDDAELKMLDVAFERRLPILAICRGMQLLNVYQGGTLIPHLAEDGHLLPDTERHHVHLEHGTALHRLVHAQSGGATSSHHQAVGELGAGLRVAARHEDGIIEAIEWMTPMRKPWLVAIQWHPERMGLDEQLAGPILGGFLEAVRARSS